MVEFISSVFKENVKNVGSNCGYCIMEYSISSLVTISRKISFRAVSTAEVLKAVVRFICVWFVY